MTTIPPLTEEAIGDLVEEVTRSSARLVGAAAGLSDDQVRAPSALPAWTRGLRHVARSADAYTWPLRSARGCPQPGSRPNTVPPPGTAEGAAELAADVRLSLERLAEEARALPADAWDRLVTALAGWRHPAWFTLWRCLRELETHHLDLRHGYRTADWPASYVMWALDGTLATLKAQQFPIGSAEAVDLGHRWELTPGGPSVAADGHVLLGWLAGRTAGPGENLPIPPAWPQPPTPGWGRADQP
ncbi:maleylpyruvate isomerase family mycothiol-dependent enzyme [Nonomuraea insulae]|uniref:Maleylpyruvate isomerase family mycothiol-dependent enzyme n=1 Tax=Nonomuraea insulae TaxID=1616787 RepID=A0ABW1CPH8_9ACTN